MIYSCHCRGIKPVQTAQERASHAGLCHAFLLVCVLPYVATSFTFEDEPDEPSSEQDEPSPIATSADNVASPNKPLKGKPLRLPYSNQVTFLT